MKSLNLKNLLLTGSAFILSIFIIIFPIYLISFLPESFGLSLTLALITFAISIYISRIVQHDTFMSTMLKIPMFSMVFSFLVHAFLISSSNLNNWFELIAAMYFASMIFFFKNPYIRIAALITALLCLDAFTNSLFRHWYFTNNLLYVLSLSALIILGLSNYAIRVYTLLIALSITLLIWTLLSNISLSHTLFNSTNIIGIFIICGSFIPYLRLNFAQTTKYVAIIYGVSLIGLALLLCFLPISISAGIIIIVISIYQQARALHIIGLILLISALLIYYYNLDITLSVKGIILMVMGITILVVQRTLQYLMRINHE